MKTQTAVVGRSFRRAWWLSTLAVVFSAQAIHAEPSLTQSAVTMAHESVDVPAQVVTKIEVRPDGNEVAVLVKGDGRLFHSARLLDENRLVVDLISVSSALKSPLVLGHHQLLKKVRVGYHADKVRLVLDLMGRPAFSVTPVGNEILVSLKPRAAEGDVSAGDGLASTAGGVVGSALAGESDAAEQERPARADARVKNGRLMGPAQGKFKVRTIQMAAEGAAQDSDSRGDDLVAGQTRFAGRRISLDFQQADITNILRLIAEVSGFNIVVGEGVKAKVTMKLVSVPWDQALDMLLKMNGLGMIRQGTIVWVDTLSNIAKQQDEEARAKEAKTKAEELVDRVFYIRNIQAQELQTSLRQYLSPRGVMNISQGSNALIVRDTEAKLAVMKQLVDGLDLQVPQVQIEARIVQADTVYARGLGIQWGIKDSNFTGNDFKFAGNATGAFAPVAGTSGTTIPRDFIVNLPAQVGGLPAVPSFGYQFGKLGPGFALDLRLSAGELLGLSKVIAAPKITTLDKREAKISQGESIPFQTTSLQGTQTTFVDANLELNVTPQITSRDPKEVGKQILMKVRATRNAVGARSNPAGPSIDRREATTQVIVRDGETMVIGGVFVDTQNNNVQGVPYLSRIPVLGWLFKNKSESVSKQELLIFMTPTIIRTT
ncbi:MAG: type IV pilus secretin PilQ [Nitrospira sp.]|nr:type IV pilus secretin PilQ [Nitrospira sp.]